MRTRWGIVLVLAALTGCAEIPTQSEEQSQRDVQAMRAWLRGPLMESCRSLPGPESRAGCVAILDSHLASLRRETSTREDEYRTELIKAKGVDELRRLWGRPERETWLRGPRTAACLKGPSLAVVRHCVEGIEKDLDILSRPDDIAVDPPEVRAEREVSRIETKKQAQAAERKRQHEMELARQQAAGQALMGLGIGGGLFRQPVAPRPPVYQAPVPVMPSAPMYQPPRPPVSCTTRTVGEVVYTDCD